MYDMGMKKRFKMGFEGIATNESVKVLLHTKLASSSHMLSNKSNASDIGKGEPAGPFKAYMMFKTHTQCSLSEHSEKKHVYSNNQTD